MEEEGSNPKGVGRKLSVREAAVAYGPVEVPASDLKNDWHHWLDQVARGRRTLVVTRYGRPIATLSPIEVTGEARPFVGALQGWVVGQGDLVTPVSGPWEAET